MTAVHSLTRAQLRLRRGWIMTALLLALVGGVVLTTAAGARRTDSAYTRYLASSRAADVLVAAQGENSRQNLAAVPSFYAGLARLPGVDLVAPLIGVVTADGGSDHPSVNMSGGTDARLGRAIERPKIIAGRMSDLARADEGVADRVLAHQLHLHLGSVLHLLVAPARHPPGGDLSRATEISVRVVGIAVTRDDVVSVNAGAAQGSLLVTPALIDGLNPDTYTYGGALIRLHRGTSVRAFGARAQALITHYPETGGQLSVADEHEQAVKVTHAIRPQAVALALIAALVALMVILVIGQVLVRQVSAAAADYPTLRALGLSRVQLVAVSLAHVVVTVVAGTALAVLIAIASSPLMPIGPARVAEPHRGFATDWGLLALGALAIVVMFVLRTASAVWRLAARPAEPVDAMAAGIERPSRILEGFTRAGAPVSAVVGARLALEPGRGSTAVPVRSALAGTAVAMAAMAAAFTFGTNLVRLVNTPRLYGQTWSVSFDGEFSTAAGPEFNAFLRQQRGVSGWTLGRHGEATIAGRAVPTISLTGAEGPAMFPTLLEGRAPRAPHEIVLGTGTLASTHRHVGETVMVTREGDASPRTMNVVGRAVFPFFGRTRFTPTGLGEGAALLDPGPNPEGYNFALVAVHGRDSPADIARLANDLSSSSLCVHAQLCDAVSAQRPADVKNYARIKSTPLVLTGVLAVLAVATLAHLLITSIRHRRRDLAILKSLGFVRRQISVAVAWEATIVVALALLVGLPIGVALGRSAWALFADRLGVAVDPRVEWVPVLVAVPSALAIANAVASAPGWVAGRLRPAPVLRIE